jgi:predicted HicB family RNase H-like nuclease
MNDIMQYKDYLASVHYSSEDDVFYGKVLGINDLINFEGSSVRALKKSFQEAIEDYITTCEEAGKDPNKSYKGTFNVRIPTQLHKEAALFAATNNISLNDFVKTAIQYSLVHKKEIRQQVNG